MMPPTPISRLRYREHMDIEEISDSLAKLHDRVLVAIRFEWRAGTVVFDLSERGPAHRIVLQGVTNLACPRNLEWGPSTSINEATLTGEIGQSIKLEIEMQTGDVLTVEAKSMNIE